MNLPTSLPVDFGNADEDGAVRVMTRGTLDYCKAHGIVFSEGMKIRMSDGEITAEGVVSQREGFGVAIVQKWLE